jgi:NAD(P)-dependent dehydrogenase (short-subunit alcohol dehydrogenase family)
MRFDGRVAVITGAGGGLGRQYALLLAGRGASVVVNDVGGDADGRGGGPAAARAVVQEISAAGGSAIASVASVADPDGARSIVADAIDHFGRLDILINNAGILRAAAFHKMSAESFDALLDVHLRGAFYVTQPAYAHMRERGYGRIVMTTSAAGLFGLCGQANYAAAKMGLVGLVKSIALEGIGYGVRCNAVAPVAYTRMTKDLMGDAAAVLDPALVAPVVGYLAHQQCVVNGEILSTHRGHVSRVFVGETAGYDDPALTIDSVADQVSAILDTSNFRIPVSTADAMPQLGAGPANGSHTATEWSKPTAHQSNGLVP